MFFLTRRLTFRFRPRSCPRQAWKDAHVDEDAFLTGARARADKYGQLGPGQVPPVRWVLVEQGGRLPEGALQIGYEQDGQALYVLFRSLLFKYPSRHRPLISPSLSYAARAFHDGCASIGKTWRDLNRANIPHKEHEIIKTSPSPFHSFLSRASLPLAD
jgi:hypothetical protein